MIVFQTWKDGRLVRPDLFLSARTVAALYPTVRSALTENYRLIPLPPFEKLPAPVADHPDLLVHGDPSGGWVLYGGYFAANRALFAPLPSQNIRLLPDPPEPRYPHDVTLNVLRIGNHLIGRIGEGHPLLAPNLTPIPVKQGYTRCSVCPVGTRAAITADAGIADALEGIGLRVLRIRPGGIALPGYDCGFIGGATVSLGRAIGFFGDPLSHPDGAQMADFVRSEGLEPITLCPGPLTDYGGGVGERLCLTPSSQTPKFRS